MDSSRKPNRLFRALLWCYPAEFREEYGGEMEHLFAERLAAEPRWKLWLETMADTAFTAPREHADTLAGDVKHSVRSLVKAPGFSAVTLLVIGLGIGATVSVFSALQAVLLRSLPYGAPERLVYVWSPNPNLKGVPDELGVNVPDFYEWQRHNHSFSHLAAFSQRSVNVVGAHSTERVAATFVTGDFFQTLAVRPQWGRALSQEDDIPRHDSAVVIGQVFSEKHFGSAEAALGQTLRLNRRALTVVGVMPKEFGFPFDGDVPYDRSGFPQTDLWMPVAYSQQAKANRGASMEGAIVIGRLKESVSAATAQAELKTLQAGLQALYPNDWKGWTALVKPFVGTILGPVRPMFWLLLAAVGLVLAIAIGNAANLLLTRTAARAHEFGLRAALGASRRRILRQLMTESLLLSLAGSGLGIVLSFAGVRLLKALDPGEIPRFQNTSVDGWALVVAVLLAVLAGVLAALVPAFSASRRGVNELLKESGSRLTIVSRSRRFALVAGEVAFSVVLLSGAGLLVRSYLRLAAVDPGFAPDALTFRLPADDHYGTPEIASKLQRNLLEKLRQIPGVREAAAASVVPLGGESVTYAEIEGFGKSKTMIEFCSATPNYRKTIGTPLLRGRDFDERDINSISNPVLINQQFAKAYFAGRDPLGARLRTGMGNFSGSAWRTVVGIVGDVRQLSVETEALPKVFEPAAAREHFVLTFDGPLLGVIGGARNALHGLDPGLSLEDVETMRQRVRKNSARRTFQTALLTAFAGIALFLTLAGLYAVVAFAVRQQVREFGIRIAVGASRGRILRLVLAEGLRPAGLGLIAGLAGAFGATRLIAGWLFGVQTSDPVTYTVVGFVILTVAVLACLGPAWNATRTDPVSVLRQA